MNQENNVLNNEPYKVDFIGIIPAVEKEPRKWCAPAGTKRPVADTKGATHSINTVQSPCC